MNTLNSISQNIQATGTSKYITRHLKTTSPHASLKILSVVLRVLAHIVASFVLMAEILYKKFLKQPVPLPTRSSGGPQGGGDLGPVDYSDDEEDASSFDTAMTFIHTLGVLGVNKFMPRPIQRVEIPQDDYYH